MVGRDKQQASPVSALYSLLKDYFFAIAVAAAIALGLRVYVVEAFRIPTDFMSPMLLPGDHIFVNKLAYGGLPGIKAPEPARGDVIVFSFPNDPTKDYIKRVVAIGGDTVEIRGSRVVLNGSTISQPADGLNNNDERFEEQLDTHSYLVQWKGANAEARKMTQVKVPQGQVFVLGDNRAKGQDSRAYGFLPIQNIKGKASLIWFSMGSSAPGGQGGSSGVRWSRLLTRVN